MTFSYGPNHRRANVGHPARTYLQQLCTDTGCSLEDLPNAIDDREEWQRRVREIHAHSTTWWWCHLLKSIILIINKTFNSISNHLGLFKESHSYLHFLCSCFLKVFFASYWIWIIDGTLTGIITPGQSGPSNNSNEGVLHSPQISRTGASSPLDVVTI